MSSHVGGRPALPNPKPAQALPPPPAMSCVPRITFSPRRSSKNPYSGRGLAQFALLSSQLEDKRKQLLDQLESPLCLVAFAGGSPSDNDKWIPIIICPAPSRRRRARVLRRGAVSLISNDPVAEDVPDRRLSQTVTSDAADDAGSRVARDHAVGLQVLASAEKLVWMAAYGLSVVADFACNALGMKAWLGVAGNRISAPAKQEIASKRDTHAAMAIPAYVQTSLPFTKLLQTGMNTTKRSPRKAPASKAPIMHTKGSNASCFTAPSSPRQASGSKASIIHTNGSKTSCFTAPSSPQHPTKLKKPLRAMVSLPKTRFVGRADVAARIHHGSTQSGKEFLQDCTTSRGGLQFVMKKAEEQENAERFSQVLFGAGMLIGLGALVMGFVPSIVGVVCWWYLIPSLSMAIGSSKPLKQGCRERSPLSTQCNNEK